MEVGAGNGLNFSHYPHEVDEVVAVTRQSVGAVLGSLTRLEALGLVRAAHGRYEPSGFTDFGSVAP